MYPLIGKWKLTYPPFRQNDSVCVNHPHHVFLYNKNFLVVKDFPFPLFMGTEDKFINLTNCQIFHLPSLGGDYISFSSSLLPTLLLYVFLVLWMSQMSTGHLTTKPYPSSLRFHWQAFSCGKLFACLKIQWNPISIHIKEGMMCVKGVSGGYNPPYATHEYMGACLLTQWETLHGNVRRGNIYWI